ncbi:MAG: hypothetical protein A2156_03735 [Deltaproteobacteria bacterium RBG_16_48_10]|nr:MAG: hypothetical protein A2156_03735 [Deltaproteobacteria bacterium RBG_16_48_10]
MGLKTRFFFRRPGFLFLKNMKIRNNLAISSNLIKSLPTSLFQREERGFPLLTKGDEGGLDVFLKVLKYYENPNSR